MISSDTIVDGNGKVEQAASRGTEQVLLCPRHEAAFQKRCVDPDSSIVLRKSALWVVRRPLRPFRRPF